MSGELCPNGPGGIRKESAGYGKKSSSRLCGGLRDKVEPRYGARVALYYYVAGMSTRRSGIAKLVSFFGRVPGVSLLIHTV